MFEKARASESVVSASSFAESWVYSKKLASSWIAPASTVTGLSVMSGRSALSGRQSSRGVGLNTLYRLLSTPWAQEGTAAINTAPAATT